MTHPEDTYPYRSRESLFETIVQQRIQIDNLQERIRKFEEMFSTKHTYRRGQPPMLPDDYLVKSVPPLSPRQAAPSRS